ncbi:unnamed protein product, partial [Rotaria sp. Silwood1]
MWCCVGVLVAASISDHIVFKSFEEYNSTLVTPSNPPAEATTTTAMWNTLATTSWSGFFPKGLYEWLSSRFNIVVSVVTSGGFVGSCWCGIKCIRNGCVFKRSWCYPKSLAEHRRRRDIRT